MAVHQAAMFSNNLKNSHGTAINRIRRHPKGTTDEGLIFAPGEDFTGGYDKVTADEPTSACPRTGFIIKYDSFPIAWKSKLHTKITLSTTEAECVALSSALRETMLIM